MKIRMKFNRRMSAGEYVPDDLSEWDDEREALETKEFSFGRKDKKVFKDRFGRRETSGRKEREERSGKSGRKDSSGRREKSGRWDSWEYEEKSGGRESREREEKSGRWNSREREEKSGRWNSREREEKSGRWEKTERGEKTGRREIWERIEKSDGRDRALRSEKDGRRENLGRADLSGSKERVKLQSDAGRKVKELRSADERKHQADIEIDKKYAWEQQKIENKLKNEKDANKTEYYETKDGEPDSGFEPDASLPNVEGRNAVLEAFRAGKTIDKLFVLEGCKDGPVQTILKEAKKQNTIINFVDKDRLAQMSDTKKHQGVIAVTAAYEYASVEDILKKAEAAGEPPFLILLDNIEDPHNLGAIIRTANVAGAHGIIIPKRRAVGLTGAVAKASAGAVNYTPVAKVTNLNQTIRELKEKGIWFVCADMDGEVMYRQNLTGPIGLVIGAEGAGVSRLVKENCDFCASIPMKGEIGSLNASTAAAVLSYEIVRQRNAGK